VRVSNNSVSCQMCLSSLFSPSEFPRFYWRKGPESGLQLSKVVDVLHGVPLALISGCAFSWDYNSSCVGEINYQSC